MWRRPGMADLRRCGRLVQELPPNPEVASIRRDLEPRYIPQTARRKVDPVPVHRESAQLKLEEAADEGASAKTYGNARGVTADGTRAPILCRQSQLQVEGAAGKFAQELGANGPAHDRMCRRNSFRGGPARVTVPPLQRDPLERRDSSRRGNPFGSPRGRQRGNHGELRVCRRSEGRHPGVCYLNAEPSTIPAQRRLKVADILLRA